jgi:nucleoside-diphosphate-sugar epimerase
MKILVIGGNRYFGKSLVQRLLNKGHQVTLLNRGNRQDDFGAQVKRIHCDRRDEEALARELHQESFDLVYDQVCYDLLEASAACEVFNGRVGRYIFTSTQSVYPPSGKDLKEEAFDAKKYHFSRVTTQGEDYGESKRQAEATFFRQASFPVVAVRFPVVLDAQDPTGRFQFHRDRIGQGLPLYFPRLDAKISFISKEDAARVLEFLGSLSYTGPVNAASPEPIRLEDFLAEFEHKLRRHAVLSETKSTEAHSPYGLEEDWYMDCGLLKSLGLELSSVKTWLPPMIEESLKSFNP